MDMKEFFAITSEVAALKEKLNARIHKDGKVYSALSRQERLDIEERILNLYAKQKEMAA